MAMEFLRISAGAYSNDGVADFPGIPFWQSVLTTYPHLIFSFQQEWPSLSKRQEKPRA